MSNESQILPGLTAFRNKCGTGLFDADRFGSADNGVCMTKPTALSRVAVWAAIRDLFHLRDVLTPGQVSTIVDAAPIIAGAKAKEELGKVRSLGELDAVVRTHAKNWTHGVVVYSQLWSINAGCGETLEEYLVNSRVEQRHYAQAALFGPMVAAGLHGTMGPREMLSLIDLNSPALEKVPSQLVSAVKAGDWEFVKSSSLSRDLVDQFNTAGREPIADARIRAGAFLGACDMSDLYKLQSFHSKSANLSDLLRKIPSGHYAILEARKTLGTQPSHDLAGAALEGVYKAWDTFSPIFVPGRTIQGNREKLGQDELYEQSEFGLEAVQYRGSRIAKSIGLWVHKLVTERRMQNTNQLGVSRELGSLMGKLKKTAEEISSSEEIDFEEALLVAREQFEVAELKRSKARPDLGLLLDTACNILTKRGVTISLDNVDPTERSLHEKIGSAIPPISQDSLGSQAAIPGAVPLDVSGSLPARFDAIFNFAKVTGTRALDGLVHLAAGTRNILPEEIEQFTNAVELYAENPSVGRQTKRILITAREFLSGAGITDIPLFDTPTAQQMVDQQIESGASPGSMTYQRLRDAAKGETLGGRSL